MMSKPMLNNTVLQFRSIMLKWKLGWSFRAYAARDNTPIGSEKVGTCKSTSLPSKSCRSLSGMEKEFIKRIFNDRVVVFILKFLQRQNQGKIDLSLKL